MRLLMIAAATVLLLSSHQRAAAQSPLDQVTKLAEESSCAAIQWKDRGRAPKAYMRGMALVYARAVCQSDRADVKVVSGARGTPGTKADRTDGLTWFDAKFVELNMPNDKAGPDTLRHAYTMMIGLGMMESSGKHCTGRDLSANFTSADSAEAGLFQTSHGVRKVHETLPALFKQYGADQKGCLLDVFSKGVTCKASDAKNWGKPEEEGFAWQKLTKTCPAFATEYAAVVLRESGGERGEYGPVRKRRAEVRTECDRMLAQVQALALSKPEICAALK